MNRRITVEFRHEGDRFRAEITYERTRHQVNLCGHCRRFDSAVQVSMRVVRLWCAGREVPQDDARFSVLVSVAEAAFRQSSIYSEAMADTGPL